jgi:hypothetical protein
MKKVFTLISLLIFSKISHAQSIQGSADTAAIKQTINTFIDAMRKGDSTLLRSTFPNGMILQMISNDKDGKAILSTKDVNNFVKTIGTSNAGVYDERIVYGAIKIDGSLASIWTPYKVYHVDQFSHCGVNVFQLMKTAEGWKVIYIVVTRRTDNCMM